jgi:hypothetical protein
VETTALAGWRGGEVQVKSILKLIAEAAIASKPCLYRMRRITVRPGTPEDVVIMAKSRQAGVTCNLIDGTVTHYRKDHAVFSYPHQSRGRHETHQIQYRMAICLCRSNVVSFIAQLCYCWW